MWALCNNFVVHIEANNLKLVQVSMIKVIGKLRHCFADLRTGTPFLVKPILGTARLTSLPRSPSFRFLRWPSSAQTATQILFFITNEKNNNKRPYWSRQAGRPQPVVKSEFRYVSVYEFLRETMQQWKQIQNWNLLDLLMSVTAEARWAIIWQLLYCALWLRVGLWTFRRFGWTCCHYHEGKSKTRRLRICPPPLPLKWMCSS